MVFIVPEKKQDQFVQEYLYIEEFPQHLPQESKKESVEDDDRGVIVIELF